jgi:excisionase family DNA binding protein
VTAPRAGDMPEIMTVPEAAAYLGIGRSAAYEAARRGQLPTLRLGRKLRVSRAAVERALLEGRRAAAGDHHVSDGPATSEKDPDTR